MENSGISVFKQMYPQMGTNFLGMYDNTYYRIGYILCIATDDLKCSEYFMIVYHELNF